MNQDQARRSEAEDKRTGGKKPSSGMMRPTDSGGVAPEGIKQNHPLRILISPRPSEAQYAAYRSALEENLKSSISYRLTGLRDTGLAETSLVCHICGNILAIEIAHTDEFGRAVHEECYVLKLLLHLATT
jgi:hypothetical protein